MRLRILIPVTVLLIVAALIGFLQAAAKDDTTTMPSPNATVNNEKSRDKGQ